MTEKQVVAVAAAAVGRGRVRSGSNTLLLEGSLFGNRLYLGRHGCVFDVVIIGGVIVGGIDVFVGLVGVVIVNALFVLV